jgi:xylulokinase
MADYLLSFDVGTSSCKTVLFDKSLTITASAIAEYKTHYLNNGWHEQDADDWWQAMITTTREILDKTNIKPSEIAGVGIDSMSSMALPVNKQGQPIRKGPIWSDRRAEKEAAFLSEIAGEAVETINQNRFDAASFASKISWYKNNDPETYNQAEYFFHCNGYLVFKLTGKATTDVSECGLSNLCNTKTSTWSEELFKPAGISPDKLPEIIECSQIAGTITASAAKEINLAEGTPVIAGAMDNTAAVLGLGLSKNGEAYISAGTATNTGISIDSPANVDNSLLLYRSAIPGLWLINGGVDFGGAGMRWLKNITSLSYLEIDALAAESSIFDHNPIFLPYLTGQRAPLWNTNTRGIFFGINPDTSSKQMIRSVMESIAFGIRWVFEMIQQKGFSISDIRMTGGCANSPPWLNIFAEILGRPVLVPGEQDASTLGTAILTGVGTGIFSSFDEALKLLTVRETHLPTHDSTTESYYKEIFELYKTLYTNSRDEMKILTNIREKFGA